MMSSDSVMLLPSISETLVASLRRKSAMGLKVHLVWRRIVRNELIRCSRDVDMLLPRERAAACDLLDWYISAVDSLDVDISETWLCLYRSDEERQRRVMSSLLNWYCRHLSGLSPHDRDTLIDMAEDYFAATGEFRDEWRSIYNL